MTGANPPPDADLESLARSLAKCESDMLVLRRAAKYAYERGDSTLARQRAGQAQEKERQARALKADIRTRNEEDQRQLAETVAEHTVSIYLITRVLEGLQAGRPRDAGRLPDDGDFLDDGVPVSRKGA